MREYNFTRVDNAYKESRKYNKPGAVAPFPPYCTIQLLNTCNFNCVMCHVPYFRNDKKELDFELFKKCIDEIARHGSLVRLIGYCEPLLYSRIKDAVRYIKRKNLLLQVTTNGVLLDSKMAEAFVEAEVDSVIFSFQGLSMEEYCFMRKVPERVYAKVLGNIRSLYKNRKKRKPHIKITTTITNRDEPSDSKKDAFSKAHKEHADEIQVTGVTNFAFLEQLPGGNRISRRLGISQPRKREGARCFLPNYEMIIRHEGDVYSCCGAITRDLLLGNAAEETLLNLWNNEKAARIRRAVSGGVLDNFEDCKVCAVRYEDENISSTADISKYDRIFLRDRSLCRAYCQTTKV